MNKLNSSELGFFTAVTYKGASKSTASSLLEKVDDYFYLGGKKARVIQEHAQSGQEAVVLSETRDSFLARVGKVLSYFTVIIPLIALIAKAALRSQHSFKIIDPQQELEKGMNISEDTIARIQQLIPKIIRREDDEAIEWLKKGGNNLVFRFNGLSTHIYKMAVPGPIGASTAIDNRFANMVEAMKVCLTYNLDHLIIPHATKFTVTNDINGKSNTYAIIAEQHLDLIPNESAQEEHYHKYSTELNEAALQLAIFVAKTGFNDVTWRNVPIINEPIEFYGSRRVALIDPEHMNNAKNGFLGDRNGSRGLVNCMFTEEQIDRVIAIARKQGVAISEKDAKKAKDRRLKELEDDRQLRVFYAQKGITTGKEPIQVDLDSLGLTLDETRQANVLGEIDWETRDFTLRTVAEDTVKEINRLINNSFDQASTKGKRFIILDTNKELFEIYNKLGLRPLQGYVSDEDKKNIWLYRVIQALVDKEHIFRLVTESGGVYWIQA